MNIQSLKEELIARGVDPRQYSIDGLAFDESCVLMKEKGKWLVYYCERGGRTSLKEYLNETEACDDLLNRVIH